MVKDHSDSERGNPPVVEHWLEREITQWVYHEGSIRRPMQPRANAVTMELHLAPRNRASWRRGARRGNNQTLNTFLDALPHRDETSNKIGEPAMDAVFTFLAKVQVKKTTHRRRREKKAAAADPRSVLFLLSRQSFGSRCR